MSPFGKFFFLARKNTRFLINSGHKTVAAIMSDFGRGGFHCGWGGVGYGITMLTMEALGNVGGQVYGFRGGGKGERNGRQRDDHR